MDLVPLYDYAEELEINVCNFVLQNPATYWHAKDYNQDDHLLKNTPPIDEIDPEILKDQLIHSGMKRNNIFMSEKCTYCEKELFHSYRRQGSSAGRMVAICGWH